MDIRPLLALLTVWTCWAGLAARGASADRGADFELSDAVTVPLADRAVLAELERAQAQINQGQWPEGIESLRQILEGSAPGVVPATPARFISLQTWCNQFLASLPGPALAHYRRLVDPLAKGWYESGRAQLDRERLKRVRNLAFASSYGDRALWDLGELALEDGDAAAARNYWQEILPVPPESRPAGWLAYPDSRIDPAQVRARLVLSSILEGSANRAAEELEQFRRWHPQASGWMGGQQVALGTALEHLLTESQKWPSQLSPADWPTLAGSPARGGQADQPVDVGPVVWRVSLPEAAPPSNFPMSNPGEEPVPGFFPVVVGDTVWIAGRNEVLAVNLADGRPAWGNTAVVYRTGEPATWAADPLEHIGFPNFSLTAAEGRLVARIGTPWTGGAAASRPLGSTARLVALDIARQGRLAAEPIEAESGWTFGGTPLVDSSRLWVAMRRNDIRPQSHVACFDLVSGRLLWRQFVAAAETPGRGTIYEAAHDLLTLAEGRIYYNSNLGAIAALDAETGRIAWVTLYPRQRQGRLPHLAPYWNRDANPCLYHRGSLAVAPAGSPRLFGLDAATGQMLWQTESTAEDARDLLGVVHDRVLAGGGRLYWIDLKSSAGRIVRSYPQGRSLPGYGRGVIADGNVYWPTRGAIEVLSARTAQPLRRIDLAALGLTGGNLLVIRGRLLIATPRELICLGPAALPVNSPKVPHGT